ncbi:response regulator transcription factor [Microbulbifer halophilus]|uniref:DNA-binding response regulator n=1 Tax=Microbulbifer halophilus TaxID=453963 RepID=A0ABW5EBN3_9GAMM|nr:response regulator transcription factor [Microbulbifer halophilus]MCW8126631.1 response regulator transcription factor [Microbulbifer halophilus]
MNPLDLLIAEDQHMVRGALKALLELEEDFRVVGDVATAEEALALLQRQPVDVLICDIELPGVSGLSLAETVQRRWPDCRRVIVTTFNRGGYIRRAVDLGVDAFLLKDAPSEQLADAIRRAAAGRRTLDPELMLDALGETDPLTTKERRALQLAAEGCNTAGIADRLCLSEGTVRNYLSGAIGKLGAHNRIEAARIARQKGWLY